LTIFYFAYWHDRRFKDRIGGPIKVFELCENLKKRGHDVVLFIPCIGYPERQTTAQVIAIPLIDAPVVRFVSFQVLSLIQALNVMITKGKPTLFLVRTMWSFLPSLLGRMLHIPVLLEVNDSPHRAYGMTASILKRTLIHLIDRLTYALSDHLLPVTQKIADDIQHIDGISRQRMTVLPSGTNTDLFKPLDRTTCCRELDLPTDDLYIGFIGTFFAYQGIDTLIACAAALIAKYEHVRFLIVGDGPMSATWLGMIEAAKLQHYFIFPGLIPYEQVPLYIGAMDICVAPLNSEAGESSAVKIFDYLSCGKPVIMTDIRGTGKSFLNSGAVLLVPPEDCRVLAQSLSLLIDSESARIDMGKRGRSYILNSFSRIKIAKDLETLAHEVIASRRASLGKDAR
jgi:glycosyltransferase involved in cell wall biosynthesis